MTEHHTEFGTIVNRNRHGLLATMRPMDLTIPELVAMGSVKPLPIVLWENVQTLMRVKHPKERADNLNFIGARAGLSPSRVKAIAEGQKRTSLEIIERLAKALGVPVWVLFVPDLDPKNSPEILTPEERANLDGFRAGRK